MKNSLFSKKSFFRLLSFNFIPSNYFMENFFSFFKKNKLNINTTFTFFLNYSSSVLSSSCFLTRFFKVDNYFLFFPNFLSLYYFSSYFSLYLRTFYIKLLKNSNFGLGKIIRLKGVGYKSYLKNRFIYFRLGRSHWCFSFIPFFFIMKIKKFFRIFLWTFLNFNTGNFLFRIKNFRKPGTYTGKGVHIRGVKFIPKKTNLKVWI